MPIQIGKALCWKFQNFLYGEDGDPIEDVQLKIP